MITVWRIALDASAPPAPGALAELSQDERDRAVGFVTDALRNRWLHAHVAVRRILAATLGVVPATIKFGRGAHGKPFLAAPSGTGLEFNLSDSGDIALLALSRDGPVGVDIERLEPGRPLEAHFGDWTRREAYLKALGLGISRRADPPRDEARWAITTLEVGAGYAAALAASRDAPIELLDWTG